MGRENPRETSPAGKPSITARDSAKSMGTVFDPRNGHGTEVGQTTFSMSSKGKPATATPKGKFSLAPAPGGEYRTNTSRD